MQTLRQNFEVLVAVAAAVMWLLLALNTPTNTYHFAPVVVAGVLPVARRMRLEASLPRSDALGWATLGVLIADAMGLILLLSDSLQGPDLFGGNQAEIETFVFAAIGGVIGALWASR
jgi:hypothetical protein